jgi:hypothetical protein
MAAGRYSFTIEQGATTDFEIVYKDSAGEPVDLSLYQARMQISNARTGSADKYLTLSSSLNDDGTGLNLSGKWFHNRKNRNIHFSCNIIRIKFYSRLL